ncbi:tripartite tricarboxylate transporter substrate binding protein [Bradyrhizobium sp. LHD-71]|uniref:Bug family tripartite tricarboxylate transporter substrate binding protein n=1 Tax=Bradyrhizobium sp. LHD-71 TaxID=3072141 RepID=UPI00280F962F|nr:tripartite tricarboxylate transporter substrate binding protein [Bradyrhizobium sp. LHD-71]MDQ8731963.1 tripartite tricarboxylate transporter substrate binding protein [Bradyrhizobium sp. LHD-71]
MGGRTSKPLEPPRADTFGFATCGWLAAGIMVALMFLAHPAHAQKYPSQPVRVVVPFAAGGGTDVLARTVAQGLSERWGAPVFVDNRPGAGSSIGTDAVAKAAPDGYTLLYTSPAYAINPALYKTLPFAQDDLVPVAIVAAAPLVLAIHPSVPANSIQELISLLKANPKKYNYATSGNGSILHMAAVLFCAMADVDVVNIPYRGAAPAMNDVLSGQVAFIFDQVSTAAQLIASQRLKGLAVTTSKRSALLPDVPTMSEAGLTGYEAYTWSLVLAPRGTPKHIINQLATDMRAVVQTPEMKKRFLDLGAEVPDAPPPETINEFVASETRKWGELIRAANITVN